MVRMSFSALLSVALMASCSTWRDEVLSAAQRGDDVAFCRAAVQNQGDPAAFVLLGHCSEEGIGGTPRDLNVAVSYYTLAARYGIPQAQSQLARLGAPIPPADLLARPPQARWLEVIGAGFSGMGEVAPAPAPALIPLPTPPFPTTCQWVGNLWTCR